MRARQTLQCFCALAFKLTRGTFSLSLRSLFSFQKKSVKLNSRYTHLSFMHLQLSLYRQAIPGNTGCEAGIHPIYIISESQSSVPTYTFAQRGWEETEEPGGKPQEHSTDSNLSFASIQDPLGCQTMPLLSHVHSDQRNNKQYPNKLSKEFYLIFSLFCQLLCIPNCT